MEPPRTPANEGERLAALAGYEVLDSAGEASFDGLAELAAHVMGAPIALVSLVDADRQWFKAKYGLDVPETPRELSFCGHVVASGEPLIVADARADARFADNPFVTGEPRIRFYAGFPLRTAEGHVLGTLCVLDRERRELSAPRRRMLSILAAQVMDELELRRKVLELESLERVRREQQRSLARTNNLLAAITAEQQSFLFGAAPSEVFSMVLDHVLVLTQSEFGFMGEVYYDDAGAPFLTTHAISNIAWDAATRRFYDENVGSGLNFRNLGTLFGAALTTGAPVISNEPQSDPRRGGLPPGHPPLHAFLGLPITKGRVLLGMIGLANRPGGYSEEVVEFLGPFLASCAGLIAARRVDADRSEARAHLRDTLETLRRSRDELARFLDLLSVGTIVVDTARAIAYVSATCRALTGLGEPSLGAPIERALPLDERGAATLKLCMELPEAERSRVGARICAADGDVHHVEIDVRDDPREPSQRILFIYDVSELHDLRDALAGGRHFGLIGDSAAMRELNLAIEQVAAGDWTVLIRGETGSGKELVARAIHAASGRRRGPFVAVNCAGLTDTLLSSQLFGHVKGAFTGATRDQPGLFEAASGGTIFLDEIGDISLSMQRSLLRVLQEREVTRVGETRARKVDTRVIAATHRDLAAMTAAAAFREDLLYRIRIARVMVPPLRDRLEDIPALVGFFLGDTRVTGGKAIRGISSAALARLQAHDWPGNVRELKGAMEHAAVCARRDTIGLDDLPPEFRARPLDDAAPRPVEEVGAEGPQGRGAQVRGEEGGAGEDDERSTILAALRRAGGNRSKAARLLGIGRATLYRRLRSLDIDAHELDR
ncbi:MAG: sigma 54-interacting transcriptional regulator [Nannocystaceae bacterium]